MEAQIELQKRALTPQLALRGVGPMGRRLRGMRSLLRFKSADIKSITVPIMEVPCCSRLPIILKKAMEGAKKET